MRSKISLSIGFILLMHCMGKAQIRDARRGVLSFHAEGLYPVTFFSLQTVPSVNGGFGLGWAVNSKWFVCSDIALGSLRSFTDGTVAKQGDYSNEYQQLHCKLAYNLLKPVKGKYVSRHTLLLGLGAAYMKSNIVYYKTDKSTRNIVDFIFWFSSFSAEYDFLITKRIGVIASANLYVGQSAWVDGYPKDYQYDHYVTFGIGTFMRLASGRK